MRILSVILSFVCVTTFGAIPEEVLELKKKAEQGDAYSQYKLGEFYKRKGMMAFPERVEAVKWFRKSAEQGYAKAQCELGVSYYLGSGVEISDVEAEKWLRLSALQGIKIAQSFLAECYQNGGSGLGEGVPINIIESYAFYDIAGEFEPLNLLKKQMTPSQIEAGQKRSIELQAQIGANNTQKKLQNTKVKADLGDAIVQNNLGHCYVKGEGVLKDPVEGVKWYTKAAEQGYAIAQFNLGLCYEQGLGVSKNPVEALKWFRKAADQGDSEAQYRIGFFYMKGEGVSINPEQVVHWYRKAAEQGHVYAQLGLGISYELGGAVPKDYVEAYAYYTLAEASVVDAGNFKKEISKKMTLAQIKAGVQRSKELQAAIDDKKKVNTM